jgi:hypothetical protein
MRFSAILGLASFWAGWVGWAGLAQAEPLVARNGEEVRLVVAQKPRKALRLKPTPNHDGWRLELGSTRANGVAEVFDVTPGTQARTYNLSISAGEVLFDRARFVGGHAYRVQLFVDGRAGASGFVYLVAEGPAKVAPRTTQRVRFDAEEPAPAKSADEIQPIKKSPL